MLKAAEQVPPCNTLMDLLVYWFDTLHDTRTAAEPLKNRLQLDIDYKINVLKGGSSSARKHKSFTIPGYLKPTKLFSFWYRCIAAAVTH